MDIREPGDRVSGQLQNLGAETGSWRVIPGFDDGYALGYGDGFCVGAAVGAVGAAAVLSFVWSVL